MNKFRDNEGIIGSLTERNRKSLSNNRPTKTNSKSKTPTKSIKKSNFGGDNGGTSESNFGNHSFNKLPLYSKEKSQLSKYDNRSKTPNRIKL